jgi:hypothetical protein
MTEKEEGCGEVDEEIVEPSGGGITVVRRVILFNLKSLSSHY